MRDVDLVSIPCVVLLGEMGIGKSTIMETLRDETKGQGICTLTIRIRPYTNEQWLENELFLSPHFAEWLASTAPLHVFIDGFDECAARIPALGTLLADRLANIPDAARSRLFIRIACRAVEWKASQLEEQLACLWGDATPLIRAVAPLREQDVYAAAEQHFADPDAFMAALRSRQVGHLAARPMTLRHLLNLYEKYGTVPRTQQEVHDQAYALLCEDKEGRQDRRLDTTERLQVASRIAALMLLANAVTIVDAPSTYQLAVGEISLQRLSGADEHIEHRSLPVSPEEIRDALNTGLFAPSDSSRFTWIHRSVAEYLTARYLAQSSLSMSRVFQLLQHPADPTHRIVPHLHAVAAWYASFEHQAFRKLLDEDFEVLLNADLGAAASLERAGLVTAFLASSNEGRWRRLNATSIFPNLVHPGLGEQLTEAVRNRHLPPDARMLAVDIANATNSVSTIETALLPVIFNSTENLRLRVHAAYAIAYQGTDSAKCALAPLTHNPIPEDKSDELKGCALRAAWPLALSAEQLFTALTPSKNPSLFGAYHLFLSHLSEDLLLDNADVPLALQWAETDAADRFSDVVQAIKRRAWTAMDQPSVAPAYARLAVREIHHASHLDHGGVDHAFLTLVSAERTGRHLTIQHLMPLLRDSPENVLWTIFGDPPLLDLQDFNWLLDQLAIGEAEDIQAWLGLITHVVFSGGEAARVEMYSSIFERREEIVALRDAFPFQTDFATPLTQETRTQWYETERQRQEREERRRRNEQQKPDIKRIINRLLDRIQDGDSKRYWHLDSLLATTAGNARVLECDLRRLPPWEESDEFTRTHILDAAYGYIVAHDDDPIREWLGTSSIHWPSLAGFRALYLLWEQRRDAISALGSSVWHHWAAAVVGCAFNVEGAARTVVQELVCLAYHNAPDRVLEALEIQLSYEVRSGYVSVVEHFARCWDERLEQCVLAYALDPSTPAGCVDQILQQLYEHRPDTTTDVLRALIGVALLAENGGQERMVIASRLLLSRAPGIWPEIYRVMQADEAFGHALAADIASTGGVVPALPEEGLADLYIWLANRYPHQDDPNVVGVHSVTAREQISTWRDMVLQALANHEGVATLEAFRRITEAFPDLLWLRQYLREAEFTALNHTWDPLSPEDLLATFRDARLRIVRNEEQLLETLLESLERFDVRLQAETALARFLWHPAGGVTWQHQDEAYLSDLIRMHLDYDLVSRGLILNREVQIRGGLDRFDIKVDATVRGERDEVRQITVIIEVKGSWNRDLFTSMQEQLTKRYLTHNNASAGIYAVGWYQCAQWRGTQHRSYTLETTRDKLTQQARDLSINGKLVRAMVLDARLPSKILDENEPAIVTDNES